MFNKDCYFSPPPLVSKIIAASGIDHDRRDDDDEHFGFGSGRYVLDPGAGNGAILDALQKRFEHAYHKKPVLYACEIEPDLAKILEGKGYPVLASDFLAYTPTLKFNYILMNPPFSLAAKFIIHAFEILSDGGVLVSVLPTSIKKQTNSFEFQAMRLIADYGEITDLGTPFAKGAERRTDEPCILVTLKKRVNGEKLEFNVENDYADKKYQESFAAPEMGMMPNGFLAKKLACYNALLQEFATYRQSHKKMVELLEEFEHDYQYSSVGDRGRDRDDTILNAAQSKMADAESFNAFFIHLTEAAWNGVLEHPEFQRSMTTRAKQQIDDFRKSRNRVDFNAANIKSMFMALVAKSDDLLKQCVFDAFDNLTGYYWGNRVHVEGWKHNSQWMVSPHCIVPWGIDTRWGGELQLSYSGRDKLSDIDKGLCTLMGLPVSAVSVYECPHCKASEFSVFGQDEGHFDTMKPSRAVCNKCKGEFPYIRSIASALEHDMGLHAGPGTCHSHFFDLRYYKKGTIHLRFRDKDVWQKLNYTASKLRGWLPDGTQPWHIVWKPKPKPANANPYKGYNPVYSGDRDERGSDEFVAEIDLKLPAPSTASTTPTQAAKRAKSSKVQNQAALALEVE